MIIGQRLRETRRAQGRTLKQIAEKAGFTEAYLSQVETSRATPSVAALIKIAAGYGLTLSDLFTDRPDGDGQIVLRSGERRQLVLRGAGVVKELLVARQAGKRMEPLYITIEPGAGSEGLYDHAGEEFGLVLSGRHELTVEDKVYRLGRGDSVYFNSTRSHGFRNPSRRTRTTMLWVITPPSL